MEEQTSCGLLLKQIHDGMERQANNELRAHDLTFAQISVLMLLDGAENGTLALKEIEKTLRVAQSTAAGIVARLEQKGFAEGCGDAADRRVKRVRITGTGRQCCGEARANMGHGEEALLSGLTEEERMILRMLLVKVRQNVL